MRCWENFFPVENFLRETMDADNWNVFCRQSLPDKLTTLLDLIEKAKARQQADRT